MNDDSQYLQQLDDEAREWAALHSLKRLVHMGLEADARVLASVCGLTTQLTQELEHEDRRTTDH